MAMTETLCGAGGMKCEQSDVPSEIPEGVCQEKVTENWRKRRWLHQEKEASRERSRLRHTQAVGMPQECLIKRPASRLMKKGKDKGQKHSNADFVPVGTNGCQAEKFCRQCRQAAGRSNKAKRCEMGIF